MRFLVEKYGDQPEWLRVHGYRQAWHPRTHRMRSELMLSLRGKDYWFPLAPRIYEAFMSLAQVRNRGAGLRYLQKYIRTYREYKERWPSKRYVRKNRLHRGSFYPEKALAANRPSLSEVAAAIAAASDTAASTRAFRKTEPGRMRQVRIPGMKPRSSYSRLTATHIS